VRKTTGKEIRLVASEISTSSTSEQINRKGMTNTKQPNSIMNKSN
jgi:hypothetical protein